MKKANLHEAKTNLSKLVELACKGEQVIICKAGEPIAQIIPFTEKKVARKGGAWKGKVKIAKDFDVLPDEFKEYSK